MADGKTHSYVNLANGVVITAAVAAFWQPEWQTTTAIGVGCLLGWLITPDLDLIGITYEERRIYRINWLLGFLWQLYWLAYARLMPHRGLSHAPLIGTMTRCVYLLLPWLLLAYGYNWLPTLSTTQYWLLAYAFLAWAAQDLMHLIRYYLDNTQN